MQAFRDRDSTSLRIANGSVLAAMMVVAIHVTGRSIDAVQSGTALWWFEALGHWGVFLIAVPFFFFCSGYLLAKHVGEDGWYYRECKKRVRSLLVPYLVWSVFFMLLPEIAYFLSNLLHGKIAFLHMAYGRYFWMNTIGLYPLRYPGMAVMWYIRALIVFVVVAPIVVWVVKRREIYVLLMGGGLLLASLAFGALAMYSIEPGLGMRLYKVQHMNGFLCFCAGVYLRVKSPKVAYKKYCALAFFVGMLIVVATAIVNATFEWQLLTVTYVVFSPLLLFSFWRIIPSCSLPSWLTGATFAIYVMHTFVWRVLQIFHVPLSVETIPQWVVKWCIGFFVPIGVTMLLRKFLPRFAGVLFGGR